MVRFSCKAWVGTMAFLVPLAIMIVPAVKAADGGPLPDNFSNQSGRMNCGAHIQCLTPDGQLGRISRLPLQDPTATALIMEDDTVTCVLQEGETKFVIELPDVVVPDRFTFLNENGKAHGELKISVSNQRLAANSSEWKEVEGVIPFAHKRLFGVSLLGIEAKYVRLSFRVEKQTPIASSNSAVQDRNETPTSEHLGSAFSSSALEKALNSPVTPARPSPVLLSSIVSSVAPLRLTSN